MATIRPVTPQEKEAQEQAKLKAAEAPITPETTQDFGEQRKIEEPTDGTSESPETSQPEETSTPEAVDMTPYVQEVVTKGELSEDSIKALAEQLGTSEDVVRFTAKGMKADAQARTDQVLNAIGGQEVYSELIDWASKNLSAEDTQAFNATITTGSVDDVINAVTQLKSKFTEVNGSPKAVKAQVTPPASSTQSQSSVTTAPRQAEVFRSMAEQMAAQRDPRYGVDPAYTQDVYDKVARSKY